MPNADHFAPRPTHTAPTSGGICAGTGIATRDGVIPIEYLMAGDDVITRAGGYVKVRAVSVRQTRQQPILIRASRAGNSADRDMYLHPASHLHLRDWRARAMCGQPAADIAVAQLVDGTRISRQSERDVALYDITLDKAQIIYANGMALLCGA